MDLSGNDGLLEWNLKSERRWERLKTWLNSMKQPTGNFISFELYFGIKNSFSNSWSWNFVPLLNFGGAAHNENKCWNDVHHAAYQEYIGPNVDCVLQKMKFLMQNCHLRDMKELTCSFVTSPTIIGEMNPDEVPMKLMIE